ncbi:MAG: hypothetical protein K0U72_04965 [Gammaproteobacteria bacterium]|nr:hypothetical protein [Gammaproteobacteria bacterium]
MIIDKIFDAIQRIFNPPTRFEDGSFVGWLNREAIVYVKRDRRVPIDFMFNPDSDVGSSRTLRLKDISYWEEENQHIPVTDEERSEIAEKVRAYCSRKGIELIVVD